MSKENNQNKSMDIDNNKLDNSTSFGASELVDEMFDEEIEVEEVNVSELNDEKLKSDIKKAITDDVYVGNAIDMFFQEMKEYPLLSATEENILVKKLVNGNEEEKKFAKEKLIVSNIRLAVYVAKKYFYHTIPIEDLIQMGCIGLAKGIEKFDYTKGLKLSTYVVGIIKSEIYRDICNNERNIRIPEYVQGKINKYKKEFNAFKDKYGYEPSNKEMGKILGITEEKVEELIMCMNDTISLDMKIGDDENNTIQDMVADKDGITPEEYTIKSIYRDEIKEIISTLKPQEQTVIKLRYGFDDGTEHTLEDIGTKLNLTRERIRQIEAVALKKLRNRMQ